MEQAVTSSFNGWMICAVYYFRAQSDDGQRVRLCDIVTLYFISFVSSFFYSLDVYYYLANFEHQKIQIKFYK